MGDIEIRSKEGFNNTISSLEQTNDQMGQKGEASEQMSSAVSSAANNGESGAPVFSATMAALNEVMGDVKKHVNAAHQSVSNATTDMRTLLTGMSGIDDAGEQEVVTA
jgi:ABC-type transporter Mla subunit MlaD